jgi:hypothetical protein
MNPNLRMPLVLACVLVAALEAPRAMHVLVEDLGGPYEGRAVAAAPLVRTTNDGASSNALLLLCVDGAQVAEPSASKIGHSSPSNHAVDRSVARTTR